MPFPKTILIKIIAAFACAFVIEAIATSSPLQTVLDDSYAIINIIPTFIIGLVFWSQLERLSRTLDHRLDWLKQPVRRTALQIITTVGIFVVMQMVILVEFHLKSGLYLFCWSWFTNSSSVVLTYVLLASLIFTSRTLDQKLKEADQQLKKEFPYVTRL